MEFMKFMEYVSALFLGDTADEIHGINGDKAPDLYTCLSGNHI